MNFVHPARNFSRRSSMKVDAGSRNLWSQPEGPPGNASATVNNQSTGPCRTKQSGIHVLTSTASSYVDLSLNQAPRKASAEANSSAKNSLCVEDFSGRDITVGSSAVRTRAFPKISSSTRAHSGAPNPGGTGARRRRRAMATAGPRRQKSYCDCGACLLGVRKLTAITFVLEESESFLYVA